MSDGDQGKAEVARLLAKAAAGAEPCEQAALLGQAAQITEHALDDPAGAIDLWRQSLALDPENRPGLDALDRLYTLSGRWHELAEVLSLRSVLAPELAEKVALQSRLAELHETELGDAEEAIELWNGVLDLDPGHAGALDAVERLLLSAERWEELAAHYERRIDQEIDLVEQKRLIERLAKLCEECLGDPVRARQARERLS